jgi:hypothetical protein
MDTEVWEKEIEQEEQQTYEEDESEDREDTERTEWEDHVAFKVLQDIREDLDNNFRRNNKNRNAEV